jgi:LacI family transcriptional regulator
VTLAQLAEATGFSRTTVCDILHRGPAARSYSDQTRKRVHDAVENLGYVPSMAARQLRRGRSGRIGLILTIDFSGQFFAEAAAAIERELRERRYRLQLAVTNGDPQTEYEQMVRLQEDQVEGVIFGPVYETTELEQHRTFFQGRVPTVLFGGVCGSEFDEVALDHIAARRLAAEHLLGKGHRRIGFLCAPRSLATQQLSMSLREELKRCGVQGGDWIVEYPVPRSIQDFFVGALEFAKRWKSSPASDRPTAMVCLNDEVAMTAISALAAEGIRVPHEISLVGCDNIPGSEYVVPALTTIDNHVEQQMNAAVTLLIRRLKNPEGPPVLRRISPSLVKRKSVLDIV